MNPNRPRLPTAVVLATLVALIPTLARAGSAGGVDGRLVDARGKPLAGAEVVFSARSNGPAPFPGLPFMGTAKKVLGRAHTDTKGRFHLAARPTGPTVVEVTWQKRPTFGWPFTPPAQGPLVVRVPKDMAGLTEPPVRLVVHVVDDAGRPVAGAKVSAGTYVDVATGADGVATFPSVYRGEKVLQVQASGYAPVTASVTVRGTRAETTVKLHPGGALVIEVRGLTGSGGAMAQVVHHGQDGDSSQITTLDDHGQAQLEGLPPGIYVVAVSAGNQAPPVPVKVTLPMSGPLILHMPRARPITGRVVDAAGRAVAGAKVSADQVLPAAAAGSLTAASDSTTTNARGRFRLAHVGAGRYTLVAERDRARSSRAVVKVGTHGVVLRFGKK